MKKVAFIRSALAVASSLAMGTALAGTTAYTSEAAFSAALGSASVTMESFESTPGGSSASMVFPTVTVSCSGTAHCPGAFGVSTVAPTDGTKGVYFGTPDTITFSFASAINAFAIDVRDLGTVDPTYFSATLSTGESVTFFTAYYAPDAYGLLFTGVIDTTGFTSVTFHGTASGDAIYFDRMQVATIGAVPEPETYAMMMAGLGLLGAMARRRKAKQPDPQPRLGYAPADMPE